MIRYINNTMLRLTKSIDYIVKSDAPNDETGLFNCGQLVIWSGASDNTIYQDPIVNWAFRALHDKAHIETGLDFSVENEIVLAKIQASKFNTNDLLADLIYYEIAGQAIYFKETGLFLENQRDFIINKLKSK